MIQFHPLQKIPSTRVLFVDADDKARASMAEALRSEDCEVDEVRSGPEALVLLERVLYDVMIIELNIPEMPGVQVMQRVRQMCSDLAIIVLTDCPTLESAITALRVNVADYLLKPCKTQNLLLTISRALEERDRRLRQQNLMDLARQAMEALGQSTAPLQLPSQPVTTNSTESGQDTVQAGALTLDRQKRLVTLKTEPPCKAELTEGEMSILTALMEKPNQVLTCAQLAKETMGCENLDKWTVENMIRSSVFRLRQKIETGPNTPRLIHTVRGRGYFFSPT